jgi:hypothetical protein
MMPMILTIEVRLKPGYELSGTAGRNRPELPPDGLAEGMLEELFWLSELLRQTKGHPDEKPVRS